MALAPRVQDLLLLALPAGGQSAARRNAWAAMSEGAARARSRREAATALGEATARAAGRRAGTGS
jgi:hypothetical protein